MPLMDLFAVALVILTDIGDLDRLFFGISF